MARRRLPPFVQQTRDKFRAWCMVAGKRVFGPSRITAAEAHRDALIMRSMPNPDGFGGALETRANQWLEAVRATRSPDTATFYEGKLTAIYRTIPPTMALERVTPAVVSEFVREALARKLSARTIQHCRRTINGLFKWCMRRGYVTQNPVAMVDWPKAQDVEPDVFTEAELATVLAGITDEAARDLVTFMAHTGLRRAEVARVQLADIDVEAGVVWVRGKARAQSQPIPVEALDATRRLAADAEKQGSATLVVGVSEDARRDRIAETFRLWQRLLNEPRLHPHALRHSVATILIRNGVSPATVQRFLRHSSYAMTSRYVNLVASDVRNAATHLRLVPEKKRRDHG